MQKRTILLSLVFLALVPLGLFLGKSVATQSPEIVFVEPTPKAQFMYYLDLIKHLTWARENGYKPVLPEHKEFDDLHANPETIATIDLEELEATFTAKTYNRSDFDKALEKLASIKETITKALEKLQVLQENWGYVIMPKYEVALTLYYVGASTYFHRLARVVMLTNKEGEFKSARGDNLVNTVVHEIVHIGMEETIVKKYRLGFWEKERIVDLICSTYLKELLPGYKCYDRADKRIDEFVNYESIVNDLPAAIERFVEKYPERVGFLDK